MALNEMLKMSTEEFSRLLKEKNIVRFYFVYNFETGRVETSHEILRPVADFLQNDPRDFDKHEGAFFELDKETDTILGAFIHKTNRGQAAGGVRYWKYDSVEDYLRDGLRLAQGMTRKNALAGLWWGGGKGVMARAQNVDPMDRIQRSRIYREYGSFMTSLEGCYVTAEDVGTGVEDMDLIFSNTRFTTCIPHQKGGSGNPSVPTAKGVVSGMEAALEFLHMGTLEGKKIAVQGAGHVGQPLISFLFEKGVSSVTVHDINPGHIAEAKEKFAGKNLIAKTVEPGDYGILFEECDILAPCAVGAVLNNRTIPNIKASVICGAANNQLEDAGRDDKLIFEHGIVYVPDFLVNRMGIVTCANEQYGYILDDPMINRHFDRTWEHSIYKTTIDVLAEAKRSGESPAMVAIRMADILAEENHPLFGHRGLEIIASLRKKEWHKQVDA
jgi:glutamate dehydrogenase/leucine dehydrogenase